MSNPSVVLAIPGDHYVWGPLHRVSATECCQTADIYRGHELACQVTVRWPSTLPKVPVVCHCEGRADANRD